MSYPDHRHINPAFRQVTPLTVLIPQQPQTPRTVRQQHPPNPYRTPQVLSNGTTWTIRQSVSASQFPTLSPYDISRSRQSVFTGPFPTPPTTDTSWSRRTSSSSLSNIPFQPPQSNYLVSHNESPYASPQLSPNPGWMNSSFVPLWTGDNPELYCVTCISRHYQINGSFHTLSLPVPVAFTSQTR